jgi:hypothetical protein
MTISMLHKFFCTFLLITMLAACAPSTPAEPTGTPLPPSPTPFPTATTTPTPVPGTLFVDPATGLGPISPYLYGSNYGPWVAVPFNMLDAAYNSHVTVLRWPGGEWGDANDVQPTQLDTFIGLFKKMDMTPTISVRLLNGTPEAAAALVRYANIEKGYNIRYWSIGNEPDLYEGRPNVDYDTVRFNREWRVIAEAMKAVDPNILLLGPELHGTYTFDFATNPKDVNGLDWMTEFLKANGDMTDMVTVHRYPYPKDNSGIAVSIDEMRANSAEWDRTIPYLRDLIREITGREIPIGITEISSYWSATISAETTPDSHFNAIWYADVLGRLIRHDVFMANVWVFANRDGGHGLIFGSELRPTYYVFQMYNHFGTEQVYAASDVPDVSIYAAKRKDGTLTLMVINLSDRQQDVPLQIQGMTLAEAGTWLFDATHTAEDTGPSDLSGGKVLLPAQSITLFELP